MFLQCDFDCMACCLSHGIILAKQHSKFSIIGLCILEKLVFVSWSPQNALGNYVASQHSTGPWSIYLLSRLQLMNSFQLRVLISGLIVRCFFAIIGLFELVGTLDLIPFSVKELCDTTTMRLNPPITNCEFGHNIVFTLAVASVGFILFVIVAEKYTGPVRSVISGQSPPRQKSKIPTKNLV